MLSYPVPIPLEEESVNELAYRIVAEQMDPIMGILDAHIELRQELKDFVDKQKQQWLCDLDETLLNAARLGATDIDLIVRNADNKYKDEILEFATKVGPTDNEIFAQSFHRLVHMHSSSLMDILMKEQKYAKVIIEMNRQRDLEVSSLIDEQQIEMERKIELLDSGTTSEDINQLLSQHYSRQNLVQKQWESNLEAKIGHQKNDYRNWVISLLSQTLYLDGPASATASASDMDHASMFFIQVPAMEESFTIYLGSQLKHMHNMRIIAANIYDFCNLSYMNESISGPNIAPGLYSSSLSGVIVLTPSGQVKANPEIVKNASMSTEFHFNQINKQIDDIQGQLAKVDERSGQKLKPGDFFITKHSNLSQTHLIFHLISDEASNSPEEINSRHPVILGLRNVLKTASRYDVTNLSIPALLRHEMSEDMTVQWCVRRAELVFKCAKGFMIESASWGGSELSNLQLVLPRDITEELFGILAGMVPQVFRLANPKYLIGSTKS